MPTYSGIQNTKGGIMMKVVRVGDLRGYKKDKEDNILETAYKFGERSLCVKQFLPTVEKNAIFSSIIDNIEPVHEQIGLSGDDMIVIDMLVKTEIVKAYSNVNLPADFMEAYDLIQACNLYNNVINSLPGQEYSELMFLYDNKLKTLAQRYPGRQDVLSLLGELVDSVKNGIANMDAGLPSSEEIEKLKQSLDNLDSAKIQEIKEFVDADERHI